MKKEEIEEIEINTEFIKLDQFLKWTNFVISGADAKLFVQEGQVKVNGDTETRRGKKLYSGDIVEFKGEKVKIK